MVASYAVVWTLAIWALAVLGASRAARKAPGLVIRRVRVLATSLVLAFPIGLVYYLVETADPHSLSRLSPVPLSLTIGLLVAAALYFLLACLVVAARTEPDRAPSFLSILRYLAR